MSEPDLVPVLVSGDQAVVWWMDVASVPASTEARWVAGLAPEERARASRFHFAADRTAYVGAHHLVRTMLTSLGRLAPSELRFVTEPRGKPEIDPAVGSDLRFNLSHARGLAAAALSVGHPVGIDVEACDRAVAATGVAGRFFAPSEVAMLDALPETARRLMFLRLWTLKEAYLKATGTGISQPLASFSFNLDPIKVAFSPEIADDADQWQFLQHYPLRRHVLAVALRRRAGPPVALTVQEQEPASI